MRVRSKALVASVVIVAATTACSKLGNLQARKAFKDANTAYQAQNYAEAALKYQEVIATDPNVNNDLSLQILADNIVTGTNTSRDIQILPRAGIDR